MKNISKVAPEKAYRLLNVGGTTLVSAVHAGVCDVMPATWACPLDVLPCKATVVVDSSHFTRKLIDASGMFALQLPTVGILKETLALGSVSKNDVPEKIEKSGAELFYMDGFEIPLVKGCAGWMIFKVVSEPHNEKAYDLIIGECIGAWADSRVFENGHWKFEEAPSDLRTLHYVAGGHFYAIGDVLRVPAEA
ncbi:MAG: flavin reductase [Opitutales bacterium]|nr:flavin reductase [Opitutales bacterium]